MQLLHIDSSITGDHRFASAQAQIVEAWKASHPDTQVAYLDLVAKAPTTSPLAAMAPALARPMA